MMLETILQNLGIPEGSIRIYVRLLECGYSNARQLAENLNLPRPTVYDNLRLLINTGLVTEKEEDNKKLFGIDDVRNLQNLARTKIEKLKTSEQQIIDLLPNLGVTTNTLQPKIKFYSGVDGIKQVLRDLLWYENIETLTMWPISEGIEILGKEYLENLNRRRIRQHISIKGIWPRDKKVDFKEYPFLGIREGHLRQLRLAPKKMTWNMSYWLYADKVAFISSQIENFGFVVHSRDFSELIRAQFEQIWKLSTPIKAPRGKTDSFLDSL